ncbi:hypothetical protein [Aeromonas jandaei]|uniref:hypothetical protein n=1 Tax=Aeromonas jandaei TaxID=650 RepID=UPI0038CFD552
MDILKVISSEALFLLRENRKVDHQSESLRRILIELRRAVRRALNDEGFCVRSTNFERMRNDDSSIINSVSAGYSLAHEASHLINSLLKDLIGKVVSRGNDIDFSTISEINDEYYLFFECIDWYVSVLNKLYRGREEAADIYEGYSHLFEYNNKIEKLKFDGLMKDIGVNFEGQVESYISNIKEKTVDSVETALRLASNRTELITKEIGSELIKLNDAVRTISKIKEWNTEYNIKMKGIVEQCEVHKNNIDSIFLAANKQGMAQSFKHRARNLVISMVFWFGVFLVSLSFTGINGYLLLQDIKQQQNKEFVNENSKVENINNQLKLSSQGIYVRMMMAAPLLWLAWFAGRQFGHASKLRQDYIYKSAVAMAYQGYKVEATEAKSYMHEKLLENIVDQFSNNPVRLYEKYESSTPLEDILKKLSPEAVAEVIKALKTK